MLGQMSQLGDLFESLKQQFDLPAKPVPLQNHGGGIQIFSKRREHHDVLGIDAGFRLQLRPVLTDFALKLLDGMGNSCFAFAHDTYPGRHRFLILKGHKHLPRGNLSSVLNCFEFFEQLKIITLLSMQDDAMWIESNR